MYHRICSAAGAALLAAALLAGATSCSESTAKPDTKPSKTTSPRQQYLTAIESAGFESWEDAGPTRQELLDYPTQWCAELDAGHSVEYVFDDVDGAGLYPIGMDWGTKKPEAYQLLVLAVTAFCPEHREQVTTEARENGGY